MRIWPIEGETQDEMLNGIREFLTGALLLSASEIENMVIEQISKCRPQANSPIYNEVCATFGDTMMRDKIASRGPYLSSYVDSMKRPTAGMRMEIPPFLLGTFMTLREVGFELRASHGRRTKTHIKFDDRTLDLFLEVRLEGGRSWTRIDAVVAREMRTESNQTEARKLLRDMPPPPRTSSTTTGLTGANSTPLGPVRRSDENMEVPLDTDLPPSNPTAAPPAPGFVATMPTLTTPGERRTTDTEPPKQTWKPKERRTAP